ncbi:Elongator subunit elp2, partial [Coemansia erecta]
VRRTHVDVRAEHLDGEAAAGVPLEERLAGGTLWAESDKLYAHAYELHAVAAGTTGRWAATACRATSARHAGVLIYRVPRDDPSAPWPPPCQTLAGHALTVTRMRFARDDRLLLTIGRDRMWIVYERSVAEEGEDEFREVARRARAHARIVWDAAWAPGGRVFATASRDKSVRVWDLAAERERAEAGGSGSGGSEPVVLAFPAAVTAVDFVPQCVGGRWVLAAALETGRVFVLAAAAQDQGVPNTWVPVEVPEECAHVAAVNRLAWCPQGSGGDGWLLASASDDHTSSAYTVFSLTALLASQLTPLSLTPSLLFSASTMRGDTVGGYTVAFLFLLATLSNILPLVYLVERSRLCVDFTATYVIVHFVLVVWSDGGLPGSLLWWVTVAVGAVGMAVGGRAACVRREMLPIRIRRFLPERNAENAPEEVELEVRTQGVLFEAPRDIAGDIDAEESRVETRPEAPLPPPPPPPKTAASAGKNGGNDNANSNDNDDDDGWNDNWGEEEEDDDDDNNDKHRPRPPAGKGAKHD